jgi:hypothetical protein
MSAGSARLNHSLKTLQERWAGTKELWSDQVSRDFEKNHLVPLVQQTESAIRGMDQIDEILKKIRQDCS